MQTVTSNDAAECSNSNLIATVLEGQGQVHRVSLEAAPSTCLFDQPLRLVARGLVPRMPYTIAATCKLSKSPCTYRSFAHYEADHHGTIDLDLAASRGGSYVGVHSMGLVWSMSASEELDDYMRCLYTMRLMDPKQSYNIEFSLCEDFMSQQALIDSKKPVAVLCRTTVTRLNMAPGVKVIKVSEGRLQGLLFVPPGTGPFPAILSLNGVTPGGVMVTQTSSLLASHGYLTFTPGTMDYKGTNLTAENIDVEYFVEALDWLSSRPMTRQEGGVSVVSYCFGSTLAFQLVMQHPSTRINAFVAINAPSYYFDYVVKLGGKPLPMYQEEDKLVEFAGRYQDRLMMRPPRPDLTIRLEEAPEHIRFLFIAGEDDYHIHPGHTYNLVARLRAAGRHKVQLLTFPGVGHMFPLPYTSFVPLTPLFGHHPTVCLAGGDIYAHARAMVPSWQAILNFVAQASITSHL